MDQIMYIQPGVSLLCTVAVLGIMRKRYFKLMDNCFVIVQTAASTLPQSVAKIVGPSASLFLCCPLCCFPKFAVIKKTSFVLQKEV